MDSAGPAHGSAGRPSGPHYRGSRPLLSWRQLKNSWKLYASSLITFCFSLALWLNMFDVPQDLRGTGDTCASPGYDYASCMMRQAVALQTPDVASQIVMITSLLSLLIIFLLLFTVVVWVVTQTFVRKNAWYLLRLLPIASLFWLINILSSLSGWQNTLGQIGVVASVALIVESGGAMLVSLNRWHQRPDRQSAILVRVLALLLTIGMVVTSIAGGIWIAALWNLFPQINLYYPGTQTQLLLGLTLMTLASISALSTLVRASRALRDVYAANPPPRYTAPSQSKSWSALLIVLFVTITLLVIISSLTHIAFVHGPIPIFILILVLATMIIGAMIARPISKNKSKGWLALLIGPFVTIALLVIISSLTHVVFVRPMLILVLVAMIVSTMIAYATLKNEEEHPSLPRQEPLQQMQE